MTRLMISAAALVATYTPAWATRGGDNYHNTGSNDWTVIPGEDVIKGGVDNFAFIIGAAST